MLIITTGLYARTQDSQKKRIMQNAAIKNLKNPHRTLK